MMSAIVGVVSLGVDLARVQLVKSQLLTAADAAARNGASGLPQGSATATSLALATAAGNSADGSPVALNAATDVIVGTWTGGIFSAGGASPNAVKVIARRTAATSSAVPLVFGQVIGMPACDVTVSSIAMLAGSYPQRVEGIGNVWLSGMPAGNYGSNGSVPANSPTQATGMAIAPGTWISFTATGSTADDPVNINQQWTPDGDPGGNRTNDTGILNGMSNLNTHQGALVGVFLDDNLPTVGAAPPDLDMSTPASRDYTTLQPQLKQPFFIGDGLTSTGVVQTVKVPAGATRLFLGTHDNVNWNNNSGYFMSTTGAAAKITTVK